MKILYVITGLGIGGAEKQLYSIARMMLARKHEVSIIYLTGHNLIDPSGLQINATSLGMPKTIWGLLQGLIKLVRIIRDYRPDVIHSHMVHANIMTRITRLFIKFPKLICSAHSINEGGALLMYFYRVTDRLSDLTTNVSQEAVDQYIKIKVAPHNKIIHVANGLDTLMFTPNLTERVNLRDRHKANDDKIIISIGRLVEAKDHANLLNAFAMVLSSHKNIQLWIAGDGHLKPNLCRIAKDLGISERVLFLGIRDDIPSLLNAADIFVLSSSWEGFGLVIAEAMLTEKLVVSTDCGGTKAVLAGLGILVPPKNSNKLASGIIEALNLSQDKENELCTKARTHIIDNYDINLIANQWEKLYSNQGNAS